ncbi:MAG: serine hydrolase domain-containing protein, partial [Desulfatibacillaceae bacterium]|nr:serine hydrolase domain-containing protein [Desulfatibacillaceae bacterium]
MNELSFLMEKAVADGVFPGAVLLADIAGESLYCEAFGLARLAPALPMTRVTIFDLASLTKPLALATTFMALADLGALSLSSPLGQAHKDFAACDKKDLPLSWLLGHCAGFPAWQPYHKSLLQVPMHQRKQALAGLIAKEALVYEPGQQTIYSDIDYMALGLVCEQAGGRTLNALARDLVYRPLDLSNELFFANAPDGSAPRLLQGRSFAATAPCQQAEKMAEGLVNDDNAAALGGVAGHAGLFGSAKGVWLLARELLALFRGRAGKSSIKPSTVKTFLTHKPGPGTFVLGFDTPSRPESSSGSFFSDLAVGHLGFTGTSFWMDLEKEAIVILLSNRTHTNPSNEAIKAFRPLIHNAAMKSQT